MWNNFIFENSNWLKTYNNDRLQFSTLIKLQTCKKIDFK